jgi:hypothetical protein
MYQLTALPLPGQRSLLLHGVLWKLDLLLTARQHAPTFHPRCKVPSNVGASVAICVRVRERERGLHQLHQPASQAIILVYEAPSAMLSMTYAVTRWGQIGGAVDCVL